VLANSAGELGGGGVDSWSGRGHGWASELDGGGLMMLLAHVPSRDEQSSLLLWYL
jgi:hypothetical protein